MWTFIIDKEFKITWDDLCDEIREIMQVVDSNLFVDLLNHPKRTDNKEGGISLFIDIGNETTGLNAPQLLFNCYQAGIDNTDHFTNQLITKIRTHLQEGDGTSIITKNIKIKLAIRMPHYSALYCVHAKEQLHENLRNRPPHRGELIEDRERRLLQEALDEAKDRIARLERIVAGLSNK